MQQSESKESKFKRLAEARVNRAIGALRSISSLSNRQIYAFDEDQVKKILAALRKEVAAIRSRFEDPGSARSGEFRL